MTIRIAVAGKGGVGKTTISSLIIRYLIKENKTPILAVDADPNANLNEGLGFQYQGTVADIREDIPGKELPPGVSKNDYINNRIQEDIVEGKGVDLLVMGRPEGRGCYCFVNELLRNFLSKLAKSYKYLVVDSEAGMEHLSRRTADDLDLLILVSDQTSLGMRTAANLLKTASKVKLKIKKIGIVVNKSKKELTTQQLDILKKAKLEVLGIVPEDATIYDFREEGRSLMELPDDNAVVKVVAKIVAEV